MLNFAVIVAMVLAAAAQTKHTHGKPLTDQPPRPLVATSGPYQKLFRIEPPKTTQPVQVVAGPKVSSKVIDMTPRLERGGCNMPIIVARPELDPKMIVTPPESAKTAARIRAIPPPPPCGK